MRQRAISFSGALCGSFQSLTTILVNPKVSIEYSNRETAVNLNNLAGDVTCVIGK